MMAAFHSTQWRSCYCACWFTVTVTVTLYGTELELVPLDPAAKCFSCQTAAWTDSFHFRIVGLEIDEKD